MQSILNGIKGNDMLLYDTLKRIEDYSYESEAECRKLWDSVAKPLGSLGMLETLTSKMAGIQHTSHPHMEKKRVLVFCADNGVTAEGVSQSDHTVTSAVALSMAGGNSNVNIMAEAAGAQVRVFDVGMKDNICVSGITVRKNKNGTADMLKESAMSREDAVSAIEAGIQSVIEAKNDGCDLLVVGEMGIGNTTTSAAMAAVFMGMDPEEVTGRGSGLSDRALERKKQVIRESIALHKPDPEDAIDVISKVGGFDIAAMTGVFIGAAAEGIPVVLDGFISNVAAYAAAVIDGRTKNIMIPSHLSKEGGAGLLLGRLGMEAPIHAGMALGEGTGGTALLPLLEMSLKVLYSSHSFKSIGVDAYTEQK